MSNSPSSSPMSVFLAISQVAFSFPYFYIEPRLVITDPARLSQDSLSSLSESFLYYGNYYFALMIGIQIDGL